MSAEGPLVDRFQRIHSNLRIGITDRCNIRCFYCMPHEEVRFKPRHELLTFEEIERFVRLVVPLGVHRLRLTGGEPLLRSDVPQLVRLLSAIPGVTDIAMTTNGILLADCAADLKRAGLRRLNISLDGLHERTFQQIARRPGVDKVLAGVAAAQRVGFDKIRLNAVSIRGVTEQEIIPLGAFARAERLELRFIEFMPLDAEQRWDVQQVLSGAEVRSILAQEFGPLVPADRPDPSQPAVDYVFADGVGRIGFINPITEPFCGNCNRLRITAEGQLRNCLFSMQEWDARALLRGGAGDDELVALIRACVGTKKAGHGIDSPEFLRPKQSMYELGG